MRYSFGFLRFFLRDLTRIFTSTLFRMSNDYKSWNISEIMQACWDKDIYVVQKPCKKGERKVEVTLQVHYKGKVLIQGKNNYVQNTKKLSDAIKDSYIYAYERLVI